MKPTYQQQRPWFAMTVHLQGEQPGLGPASVPFTASWQSSTVSVGFVPSREGTLRVWCGLKGRLPLTHTSGMCAFLGILLCFHLSSFAASGCAELESEAGLEQYIAAKHPSSILKVNGVRALRTFHSSAGTSAQMKQGEHAGEIPAAEVQAGPPAAARLLLTASHLELPAGRPAVLYFLLKV